MLSPPLNRLFEPALDRAARQLDIRLDPATRSSAGHEQLRMVLVHTRAATLASTLFALLLAAQLQGVVPTAQVLAWVLLKLSVAAARVALSTAYQRRGGAVDTWPRWRSGMLWLLLLDGLVWGLAGLRLVHEPVPQLALMIAALDGVSCVATFGLQVSVSATAAYVVPMLLPLSLGVLLRGDDLALFTALGEGLLLALLLSTARGTSKRLAMGVLLRLQAQSLVAAKDDALRHARELGDLRTEFVAKVSHELRTPLHGMLGLTRLLQLDSADPVANRRLQLIEHSGNHLLGLINDLLDTARVNSGRFELQPAAFDLQAQLVQAAELFALRAADKGLQFNLQSSLPQPCWVLGDATRLRQVLHNLLGNALKFTHHGGFSLQAQPGDAPGSVRLAVHDSGQGIAADRLDKLFAPILPGSEASGGRQHGVGMGLAISREIVQAMGGDLAVHSVPGQGASVSITVALPAVTAPPGALSPAALASRLPQRVLVAEDDEVNALIVTAYLASLGVPFERVANGRDAVEQALRSSNRPDLVLMDYRMPVLDGPGAARQIRAHEAAHGLPRLPILALTATTSDVDHQTCLDAGMDALVGKPFTLEQLAQAMAGLSSPPGDPPGRPAAHRGRGATVAVDPIPPAHARCQVHPIHPRPDQPQQRQPR